MAFTQKLLACRRQAVLPSRRTLQPPLAPRLRPAADPFGSESMPPLMLEEAALPFQNAGFLPLAAESDRESLLFTLFAHESCKKADVPLGRLTKDQEDVESDGSGAHLTYSAASTRTSTPVTLG
eukprot:CAMPEP_0171117618 /NCGR_PEP_ID=MMETSP0766_2-20121228/92920_1 /TAXON_ID=439317 /ORGANISM="Gambierdiscus australes, Strain CAWD 149" /LENGTH=123 /DNA_ID=CAMNT_0011580133 /DNA_START=65 /DNA_END=433 /DNA_ORIENTATION=+